MSKTFARFAARTAGLTGHYLTFLLALGAIVVWAATGPLFAFSDTWQLVINTGTTIITFLMVFLIQNTQNRDALAMHLKLDELIRATADADDAVMDAEDRTDAQLAELKAKYAQLCAEHDELRAKLQVSAS
jgi:low affinity Fe/Cu permease